MSGRSQLSIETHWGWSNCNFFLLLIYCVTEKNVCLESAGFTFPPSLNVYLHSCSVTYKCSWEMLCLGTLSLRLLRTCVFKRKKNPCHSVVLVKMSVQLRLITTVLVFRCVYWFGYSAAGQRQHAPLPQAASSLAHEGLVLPLVGIQAQEHGILPLIEAGAHTAHHTVQQTAVLQIILNIICLLLLIFWGY